MEALEHLRALGFSEYEARAYVALLQGGPLTGYQLAKVSGIPRPNIYPVLDRLQQRGAAARIEVKGGVTYNALSAEEMLSRLARSVEIHLERARGALEEVGAAMPGEHVWNIQGYDAVIARAEALVDGTRRRLLAGVWAEESRRLSRAFERAQARGVEPTILCIQGCPEECGGCRGRIYRYPVAAGFETRWLIFAGDDEELLVGQVLADGGATAAVTKLESFVAVASQYLRNTIAAAEIVRCLGPRLPQLLDGAALGALKGAGLATDDQSWLERIFSTVGSGPNPADRP